MSRVKESRCLLMEEWLTLTMEVNSSNTRIIFNKVLKTSTWGDWYWNSEFLCWIHCISYSIGKPTKAGPAKNVLICERGKNLKAEWDQWGNSRQPDLGKWNKSSSRISIFASPCPSHALIFGWDWLNGYQKNYRFLEFCQRPQAGSQLSCS